MTAQSALYYTVKVAGGGPSVQACAVFLRAESRDGDKLGQTPYFGPWTPTFSLLYAFRGARGCGFVDFYDGTRCFFLIRDCDLCICGLSLSGSGAREPRDVRDLPIVPTTERER